LMILIRGGKFRPGHFDKKVKPWGNGLWEGNCFKADAFLWDGMNNQKHPARSAVHGYSHIPPLINRKGHILFMKSL